MSQFGVNGIDRLLQALAMRTIASGSVAVRSAARLVSMVVLATLMLWSAPAQAQNCPTQTASIASGGVASFDMTTCSPFGMNGAPTVPASHGSVSFANVLSTVNYTNSGDGATSDTFTIDDASGYPVIFNITIAAPVATIQVLPSSLTNPTIGNAYSQQLSSSGGTANYTYMLNSGSLPSGITLSSNGLISGTPTATGSFIFAIKSTDATAQSVIKNYQMTISTPTITASPGSTTFNGTRTIAFSQQLTGGGGTAPYTFTLDTGPLPPGITLSSSGLFSGTPTTAATYPVTIQVKDSTVGSGNGNYSSLINYTLAIAELPPVPIATSSAITMAYNSPSTNTPLTLSGGTATSVTVATPAGHGTATASGTSISYQPATNFTGTDTFIYYASNLGGSSSTATVTVTVSAPPALTLSPTANATFNAVAGTAFSQTFSASGASGSYTYALTGTLPAGIAFVPGSGVLSGTATASGSFPISVSATDTSTGNGPFTLQQSYTLVVAAPSITLTPTTLTQPQVGIAFTQALSASGGTSAYTYAVTAGTLPSGLSLTSGTISGTPVSAGAYSFTITATDALGFQGTQAYSGTVGAGKPVPAASSATVAYSSSSNAISTTISGGTATSLMISTQASHGIATTVGTTLLYTPVSGYSGTDSFSYTATNSVGTSAAATVSITVSAPGFSMTPNSSTLTAATAGTTYTQTFTFTGGTAPYTYALTGTLPAGLTFDTSGTYPKISGIPTQTGDFSFSVRMSSDGSTGTTPSYPSTSYTLHVNAPTLTLSPATLTQPQSSIAFSQTISTSGGTSPYTYAVTSGSLPSGLSLTSGTISGTPGSAAAYSFTITATDALGFQGSQAYSGTVGAGKPVPAASSATVAYSSSSNVISTSISGGTATSLTISTQATHGTASTSGTTLFYTPVSGYSGTDSFSYTGTNSVGTSSAATVSITVSVPVFTMSPSSSTLTTATAGTTYTQTFTFTGGTAPYTYALTGTLPAGLTFDTSGSSPKISGIPTQTGDFSFSVRMSSDGSTGTTPGYPSTSYTLHVNAPTLTLSPTTLTQPQNGIAFSQTISTSGGTSPYTYAVTAGSLPSGLSLTSGTISGTPGSAAAYSFTITATDALGFQGSQAYSGTVGAGKPVTAASSATVAFGSSSNVISTSISGGSATSLTISTQATHGTASTSGATLLYTPASGYSGTDSFSYTATNAVGTSNAATVSITVSAPALVMTPSSAWSATQGSSYSQTLSLSGGTAPYTFATVTGLPSGLSVTATTATSLTIAGTPTSYGSFSVVVSATDSTTPTPTSKTQTFSLTVGQAVPVAVADTVSTSANQTVSIPVTSNDTGNITSIVIGTAPTHGSATVNGLAVLYTPTTNYAGSDSFSYTASGPGGSSSPAVVTLTVAALAAPTSAAQTATVAPGQAVTLHVGAAATNGPITAVTIVTTPATGSAVVSGTDIIYTAATGVSGTVSFSYTLTSAFGTSIPVIATITVGALPVIVNQSATGAAGAVVVVDLMTGASGGPFTGASVGAVTPATAGTAVISNAGSSASPAYRLTFTPLATFAGTASMTYTLSNTSGTSAAATVSVTIAARTNAANDTQVRGLLAAHSETASRFATAQLGNFSRRLEALHGSGWARSSFGLGLTPTTVPEKPLVAKWDDDEVDRVVGNPLQSGMRKVGWPLSTRTDTVAAANRKAVADDLPELPGKTEERKQELSLWIAGTVDFGHRNSSGQQDGFRFTTNGVSMGADYRLSDTFSVGVGTGYSRDRTDIGENGSKSIGQSVVATVYGSVRPIPAIFIDGLIGYGALNFDSTRYVTDDGSFATGQRGGTQMFVAVSGGYEFRNENLLWSPYGKLDLASTTLAQYSETAIANNALTYFKQRSRISSGTLGMRAEGQYLSRLGTWNPRARIEYRHQFSGADEAGISYTDQAAAGPAYIIRSADSFTGNWTAGLGAKLLLANGTSLIVDYSSNLNVGQGRYQSVLFGVNVPLR